jgi:hypothetical protein
MNDQSAEKDARRVKVYIEPADWWIGYYRGPNHHYVCLLPLVVIRWPRRWAGRRGATTTTTTTTGHCPRHPDYHPWRRLADMAADIGDSVGGSDPGLANRAYALAGAIKEAMPDHPYFVGFNPPGGEA